MDVFSRYYLKNLIGFCSGLLFFIVCESVNAQSLEQRLKPYLKNGAILIAKDHDIQFALNEQKPFKIASLLKYGTALAALHYLTPSYQFQTEFYLDQASNLYVKGYGDPFLVSEEWARIVEKLHHQKLLPQTLQHIYLDHFAFEDVSAIPGVEDTHNPYDALNGALVANFNTVYVRKEASGRILSAEPQTPLTPLAHELSQQLRPGKHRINISQNREQSQRYVGELLQKFLEQKGYSIQGQVQNRQVPLSMKPIYVHRNSKPLIETIAGMMVYSNNFIANQLLLTLGGHDGSDVTLEQGVTKLQQYLLKELKLNSQTFSVREGSGISRGNQMSALDLWLVLKAFFPYRRNLSEQNGMFIKTGTLKGVYNIAGYFQHDQTWYYIVILLNQKSNYRQKILSIIQEELRSQK